MNPFLEDNRAEVPTWLYRYYDGAGALLYIGISNEPKTRLLRHVRSDWYKIAVAVFYECFPTRRLAEAAEKMAILIEDPEHNIVRKHCDHISAHDCNWYFDITDDALVGQGRFWANPRDAMLAHIERPAYLAEPAPIMPRLTNRACA